MTHYAILPIFFALLALLAAAALATELFLRKRRKSAPARDTESDSEEEGKEEKPRPAGCCGMHAVCERELLAAPGEEAVYYEDEELDAYRGRTADSYTDKEIEAFEDVLYTMRPDEVPGWTRSLRLRGISLPETLRDDVLMMAGDAAKTESERTTQAQ